MAVGAVHCRSVRPTVAHGGDGGGDALGHAIAVALAAERH